jgi:hypothetical protein
MFFKSLIGLPLILVAIPLWLWADARRMRQRREYTDKIFASDPASRPERDAGPSDPGGDLR